jgi:NAD(P)-dependent dehydrogenase (short-subunit alcohol dehydrogenase family)
LELKGKVAIITGGASGIGESIAKTFAQEGAIVVIADINENKGRKLVEEIVENGGTSMILHTDVSKEREIIQMVESTLSNFDSIDILVNNAGIGYGLSYPAGGSLIIPDHIFIENLTEEEWERVMNVNLKSVFLCSKHVIPIMKKQQSGCILNISSVAGIKGGGIKGGSGPHYAVAKAGIINLTKALARQLGPFNIRANCIAPGSIGGSDPDGTTSHGFPMTKEEIEEEIGVMSVKRIGIPKDIAYTALFLVSDKAGFIDGQTIIVDGGIMM